MSFCQSTDQRCVCRKSWSPVKLGWFWRSESRIRPSATRDCQAAAGLNRASTDAAELAKSWSTGVRKKSEYSDVPAACQARAASVTPPTSVRAPRLNDRLR